MLYLAALLAAPLGCSLGIYVIDRLIFKYSNHTGWRILAGFLLGFFGIFTVWKVLPLFGMNVFLWIPPVCRTDIDAYVIPFITAFFSLVGYHSIGIFSYFFNKTRIATTDTGSKRTIYLSRLSWLLLLLSILVIFLSIVFRPTPWRQEKKARKFLVKVVTSINENTDFYKKHTKKQALDRIKKYRHLIIEDRHIKLYGSSEQGVHEYFVTFGKMYKFKVNIRVTKGAFILDRFYYVGIK